MPPQHINHHTFLLSYHATYFGGRLVRYFFNPSVFRFIISILVNKFSRRCCSLFNYPFKYIKYDTYRASKYVSREYVIKCQFCLSYLLYINWCKCVKMLLTTVFFRDFTVFNHIFCVKSKQKRYGKKKTMKQSNKKNINNINELL